MLCLCSVSRSLKVPVSTKKIQLDTNLILPAALMLLTIPAQWYAAWVIAAVVHELYHCIGVWLCGSRIHSIHICATGAKITTDLSNTAHEIFCLLAGPIGALSLLFLSKCFPSVAVCALMQSVYNLLPLPELDGGQVVKRIFDLFVSPHISDKICMVVQAFTVAFVVSLCLLGWIVFRLGIILLVLAGIFLLRHGKIKIPCKDRWQAVQ